MLLWELPLMGSMGTGGSSVRQRKGRGLAGRLGRLGLGNQDLLDLAHDLRGLRIQGLQLFDFCSAGMLLASILRICSMTLLSWRSNCLIWRV